MSSGSMSKVAFKYAKPTEQGIEVLKKGLKFPDAKISVKNNCVQIDLPNKESLVLELKNYTPKNLSRKIHFWNAPKEFLSILKNCPDWENLRTDTTMKYNNMFTYRMVLARIAARILQHNNFRYVIFEKDLKNHSVFVSNLIKQLFGKSDISELTTEESEQLLFVHDNTSRVYSVSNQAVTESLLIGYGCDISVSEFDDCIKYMSYVLKTFHFPGEGTALVEVTDRLIVNLASSIRWRDSLIDQLAQIYNFKLEPMQDEIIPFMEVELDIYGDPKEFGVFKSHLEYLGKSAGLTDEQLQFMLSYHEMTPIDNPEKFIADLKANKMVSGWELLKANPISQPNPTSQSNQTIPVLDTIKVENLVELPKSVQIGQSKPAKLNIE